MVVVAVHLLDDKIYSVVLKRIEVVDSREPYRIGRSVETVVIEVLQELFLFVVQL